jgi:hypothetical protein
VDTLLEKDLAGAEESTGNNDDRGCTVSSLYVLSLGDFDELFKLREELGITIFAVGWMTSICLRMVAPSLVMRTSPLESWIILSIPLGPREVLTTSERAIRDKIKNRGKETFSGGDVAGTNIVLLLVLVESLVLG